MTASAGERFWGGVFFGPRGRGFVGEGRLAELADDLVSVASDRVIESALRPERASKFDREIAFARFAAEFRKHADAPNPIGSFHFWNRTRRLVALCPYGMLREAPEVL